MSFSYTSLVSSPLLAINSPGLDFGLELQCQAWIPYCEVNHKSNLSIRVVGE